MGKPKLSAGTPEYSNILTNPKCSVLVGVLMKLFVPVIKDAMVIPLMPDHVSILAPTTYGAIVQENLTGMTSLILPGYCHVIAKLSLL
jgi:hypothetical protein